MAANSVIKRTSAKPPGQIHTGNSSDRYQTSDASVPSVALAPARAAGAPKRRKHVTIPFEAIPTGEALNSGFLRLGHWVATHPRVLLIAWIVAIAIGAWGEYKLPGATIGGTGGIPG